MAPPKRASSVRFLLLFLIASAFVASASARPSWRDALSVRRLLQDEDSLDQVVGDDSSNANGRSNGLTGRSGSQQQEQQEEPSTPTCGSGEDLVGEGGNNNYCRQDETIYSCQDGKTYANCAATSITGYFCCSGAGAQPPQEQETTPPEGTDGQDDTDSGDDNRSQLVDDEPEDSEDDAEEETQETNTPQEQTPPTGTEEEEEEDTAVEDEDEDEDTSTDDEDTTQENDTTNENNGDDDDVEEENDEDDVEEDNNTTEEESPEDEEGAEEDAQDVPDEKEVEESTKGVEETVNSLPEEQVQSLLGGSTEVDSQVVATLANSVNRVQEDTFEKEDTKAADNVAEKIVTRLETEVNVASAAAACAYGIKRGKGVVFAKTYAYSAVYVIKKSYSIKTCYNIVTSFALAVSSTYKSNPSAAKEATVAFSKALTTAGNCDVVVVQIVQVFVSVVTTLVSVTKEVVYVFG